MAGYTRQSSFVDGNIGYASLWNAEYDQILAAFDGTTGHTHDGTVGNAAKINADVLIYNPGVSGLTATDVQAAIDEVEARLDASEAASGISFDPVPSGMTAVTVQLAVEEVEARLTVAETAVGTSYDNSTSGLVATDVQVAIDEVEGRVDATEAATGVSYSNATSGLVAGDVQAAVDEVEGRLDVAETAIGTAYDNTTSGLIAVNVQTAVDEVEDRLDTVEGAVAAGPVQSIGGETGIVPLSVLPITAFNVGSSTSDQTLVINSAGTAVVGDDNFLQRATASLYAYNNLG